MKSLFVAIVVASVALGTDYTCSSDGYDGYLGDRSHKCDKYPNEDCLNAFQGFALDEFESSCQTYGLNKDTTAYSTLLTDLADWDRPGIEKLQKIYLEYKGGSASYIDTDPTKSYGVLHFEDHLDCESRSKRCMSAAPSGEADVEAVHHQSHIYGAALAFETAFYRATKKKIRVSIDYIKQCVFTSRTVLTLGAHPYELLSAINEAGVVTDDGWRDAKIKAEEDNTSPCAVAKAAIDPSDGFFTTAHSTGHSKAGLMNFFHDYVPLAILAIDYEKLRYVDKMEQTVEDKEDYVTIRAGYHEPTMFAVVTEYLDSTGTRSGFWKVNTSVLPCMPVQLYLPIGADHTNSGYAGITAFVGGVDYTGFVPDHIAFHPYNITVSMRQYVDGVKLEGSENFTPEKYLEMIRSASDMSQAFKNTKFFAYFADTDTYLDVNDLLKEVAAEVATIPNRESLRDDKLIMYFAMPVQFFDFKEIAGYLDGITDLIEAVQPEEVFFDMLGISRTEDVFELFTRLLMNASLKYIRIHNLNPSFYTTDFEQDMTSFLTNLGSFGQDQLVLDLTTFDPDIQAPENIIGTSVNGTYQVVFNNPMSQSDLCSMYPEDLAQHCRDWWGY